MQIALRHLRAAVDRVHVGVLEPRREQSAVDADHLGVGPRQCADIAVVADRHDAAVGHCHCPFLRWAPEPGEVTTPDKDHIRIRHER